MTSAPEPSSPDPPAPADVPPLPSAPTVLQRAKALWCQLVSGLG